MLVRGGGVGGGRRIKLVRLIRLLLLLLLVVLRLLLLHLLLLRGKGPRVERGLVF